MGTLVPQEEDTPKRILWYKPLGFLGVIRPHRRDKDVFDDHDNTCTAHSGANKAHDWAVEQLSDLFRTIQHIG